MAAPTDPNGPPALALQRAGDNPAAVIDKIEIVKRATMRRAKLYFLRDKVAREARRMLRRTVLVNKSAAPVVTGIEEEPIEIAAATPEETAAAEQV